MGVLGVKFIGHSDKKKNVSQYQDVCFSGFNRWLRDSPSISSVTYEYLPPNFDKEWQKKWLRLVSKLWYFGEYITNPDEIPETRTIEFDLKKITGFRLYTTVAMVRMMRERESALKSFQFSDLNGSSKEIGDALFRHSIALDAYNYCQFWNSDHTIFPHHPNRKWIIKDFNNWQFNSLKTEPNQPCLFEGRLYNFIDEKHKSMYTPILFKSHFLSENTE